MKKILSVFLAALLMLGSVPALGAEDAIKVYLDGEELVFDVDPIIEDSRTLVPMRVIFEALDCTVDYTEEDGVKKVTATKGTDVISLIIGEYDMGVNGKTKGLDVAPKIVDDRTLIPLRAVSEALNTTVEWNNNERAVYIFTRKGQYNIRTISSNEAIYSPEGKALAEISVKYPYIVNDAADSFVDYINLEYKTAAEEFVNDIKEEYTEYANSMAEEMGAKYRTMEFELSYIVTLNRMNMLSLTNKYYYDTLGAHPNHTAVSRSFQMLLNKELSLCDVLDAEQEDVNHLVYDEFKIYFENFYKEAGIEPDSEQLKTVEEEADKVSFLLTDNSLILYFVPYQVAPYALGYPTVEIPYTDNNGIVKLDLSMADCESLTFSMDSNPTTGYRWIFDVSENLHLTEKYIAPEASDIPVEGKGGTQEFTITGLKEGNGTVKAYYMRPWEENSSAIEVKTFNFYVDNNLKITLIEYKD